MPARVTVTTPTVGPCSPEESLIVSTEGESAQKYLYLPDTMANWPWPRRINPCYEEVALEANAWLKSFEPLDPESQDAYDRCDIGRLAALIYPEVSRDILRIAIDLMNIFLLIDEYTDIEPALVVRDMISVIIDAIQHPDIPRPKGDVVLGEMMRQFWTRARNMATPEACRHFQRASIAYFSSIIDQAEHRDNNTILTIEGYLMSRRNNVGIFPCYFVGELLLSIPDEVFHHPAIQALGLLIADLVALDNDIASYNREQAMGDDQYNILTIVMYQFSCDVDSAMEWVANYHKEIETRFMAAYKSVPSWGPEVDVQVQEYIQHLANWPRGNDCWNFESCRYFGRKGREYQKTRLVPLLPKRSRKPNLQPEQVEVPLFEELEQPQVDPSGMVLAYA